MCISFEISVNPKIVLCGKISGNSSTFAQNITIPQNISLTARKEKMRGSFYFKHTKRTEPCETYFKFVELVFKIQNIV